MNTSNQPVKKFEWTSQLVSEYAGLLLSEVKINGYPITTVEDFEKTEEVTDTPVQQERIEVSNMKHIERHNGDKGIIFSVSTLVLSDKFPAIKQAIEAVLNNDDLLPKDLDVQMYKLVRDNEALKSINEQLTEHIDFLNKDLLTSKRLFTQSEVDTIRKETWEACRKCNDNCGVNEEFFFCYPTLEDYLKSLAEQKLKFGNNPKLGAAFYGEDGKLKEIVTATTPTSNADTKDWQVLRYSVATGVQCFPEWYKGQEIYSVLRKSDNQVFCVGDEVNCDKCPESFSQQTIEKFQIADKGFMIASCAGVATSINNISKLEPRPLFEEAIRKVINSYSIENRSDTPDYILAQYIADCLMAYEKAHRLKNQNKN